MTTDITQDRSHVLRRRWPEVACAALLLLMGFNLLSVVSRKSITIDETSAIPALLGGSVLLPLYGVEYVDLLAPPGSSQPATPYVALGASFLNGTSVPGWSEGSRRETKEQQRNFFADYRHRTPEAVFGGSIYLYRVSE